MDFYLIVAISKELVKQFRGHDQINQKVFEN